MVRNTEPTGFLAFVTVTLTALAFGWWQQNVAAGLFMFMLPTVVGYTALSVIGWTR